MKSKYFLTTLMFLSLSTGIHAAGSPSHENFTDLIALSNSAIELGQEGNVNAFIDKTKETLEVLKAQEEKGSSIRLQRTSEELKTALKAARDNKLQEGIKAIEQGIAIMKAEK